MVCFICGIGAILTTCGINTVHLAWGRVQMDPMTIASVFALAVASFAIGYAVYALVPGINGTLRKVFHIGSGCQHHKS